MRLISAEAVRERLSVPLTVQAVRGALREQARGRTTTSVPPLLQLPLAQDGRFQAKAAQVGGIVGLRIAGERGGQHVDEGRRLLLYDAVHLTPVAMLDERDLYRFRVAGQIVVAVERLRPDDGRTLTVVGAGRLARSAVAALQEMTPFEQVHIHARTPASAEAAAAELRAGSPGEISATRDLGAAVAASDVVLTLTTAREPVVSGSDLRPGTLVVSAGGGWECDAEVYRRAARLVVDDWEHCAQVGDLAVLSRDGTVTSAAVSATLAEVIVDASFPPCAPDEVVVVVPQGMTILDVAVAAAVLDVA